MNEGFKRTFGLTNAILKVGGKVLGAAAKAGGDALKNANDKQHLEIALDAMETIMFGRRWLPGTTRPPLRTMPLNNDEIDRFRGAYRRLISKGIPLPQHVAHFAKSRKLD